MRRPPLVLFGLLSILAYGAAQSATYTNPVLPGDHPDPSITRVGGDYWATSTSSAWAPVFPILHSRNLVNWTIEGAVFQQPPAWSAGSYWAPEISAYKGRFFVYYTARKRNGPLCVAVATAEQPRGPYEDHGPLVCEEVGSIDPVTAEDEKGTRYLIWKRDGNSRKQPTPIQIQRLSEDGTGLEGAQKELITNDQPWEQQLIEGPYVLRREGWYYLFYSAAGCCGLKCDYRVGVARSRHLLGPYEKYEKNPILAGNSSWICPGHGSIVVDPEGRDFFLYHAYDAKDSIFVGREGMLDLVTWTSEGWPVIDNHRGPSVRAPLPFPSGSADHNTQVFEDTFSGNKLRPEWQWPWNEPPSVHLDGAGWLKLAPKGPQASDRVGAVLALAPTAGDYVATVKLDAQSVQQQDWAGLTVYGDARNALGIALHDGNIMVWRRRDGKDETTATIDWRGKPELYLQLSVADGDRYTFAASPDGSNWNAVKESLAGNYLPPWDLAARIAITAGGSAATAARFASFHVVFSRTGKATTSFWVWFNPQEALTLT